MWAIGLTALFCTLGGALIGFCLGARWMEGLYQGWLALARPGRGHTTHGEACTAAELLRALNAVEGGRAPVEVVYYVDGRSQVQRVVRGLQ